MALINLEAYVKRIKEEENFTPYSFWDDAKGGGKGQWTWGYGTEAPGPGATCTKEQAEGELRNRVQSNVMVFSRVFKDVFIPDTKALALLDMLYNLGETRFKTFKKMITAVKKGDWTEAGKQVRKSVYYGQVPKRAEINAQIIERG